MIHRTSKMIANFLFNTGIINEEEAEIYIYGYETLISGIIDFALVLFIGGILGQITAAIIFFTMFVAVRLYTGGYHADTYLKCKSLFAAIVLMVLMISKINIPMYVDLMIIGLFISTVYLLAPIVNVKKPLTKSEIKKYHKVSIFQSVFWSLLAVSTYFFKISISSTIMGTMFFITLLMIVERYRKEEVLYEEDNC